VTGRIAVVLATAAAIVLATAVASCREDGPTRSAAVSSVCAACTDPEAEAGSYVSIGVMPAPYPISWTSPYRMFVTTLGTSAVATKIDAGGLDRSHSIGHVLLKVRCGTDEPTYISQTGANGKTWRQFLAVYRAGPSYLFETQNDGKLYTDDEARKDWKDSIDAQNKLANETYQSTPKIEGLGNAIERTVMKLLDGMPTVVRDMKALPAEPRHRFVRATIRISDDQCRAILTWKKAYVASGGSKRYSVHRAPWVMDGDGRYDGGGCASVGFAGAFYAAGLDYKTVAKRVTERLQIGTSRLTRTTVRDIRKPNGWYNVQNVSRYVPGTIPCAKDTVGGGCYGAGIAWTDDHWTNWSGGTRWLGGAKDEEFTFSKAWVTNKDVDARTVPLIVFEPERFYQEIRARWNNADHDAFGYGDWCKLNGKVPTIVLDASSVGGANRPEEAAKGRPKGLADGFLNKDVRLPWP